jgi:hypothetical protein
VTYMQKNHPERAGRQRLNVDFGNGYTIVALTAEDGTILLHDYLSWSRPFPTYWEGHSVPRIPSQILYSNTGNRYIGAEEPPAGMVPAGLARGLRHYIIENSAVQVPAGTGKMTGYRDAGSDFLVALLTHTSYNNAGTREVVFSVPVNAPEHYIAWLRTVATAAGFIVPFIIDEACAAARGSAPYTRVGIPPDRFPS